MGQWDRLLVSIGNPLLAAVLATVWVTYTVYVLVYRHRILAGKAERHRERLTGEAEEETVIDGDEWETYDPRSNAYKFQAAGFDIPPEKADVYLIGISAGLGVVVTVLVLALGVPPLICLILGLLAAAYPRQWLDGKVKALGRQIDTELQDAYAHIASRVKQSSNIEGMLMDVAEILESKTMNSPLARELRRTAIGLRHEGRRALDDLERRSAYLSPSLGTLAFQLKGYMERGGQTYAESFAHSAGTMQ